MRGVWVVALALTGCGRLGFHGLFGGDDGPPPADADRDAARAVDAMPDALLTVEVPVASTACSTVAPSYDCNSAWASLNTTMNEWYGSGSCSCDGITTCQATTTADLGSVQTLVAFSTLPQQLEQLWVDTSLDNGTWTPAFYADDGAVGDVGTAGQAGYGLGALIAGRIEVFSAGAVSAHYVRLTVAANWCAFTGVSDTRVYAPQ